MDSETSTYQKTAREEKGISNRVRYTLWQGPDHLLQIYSRLGVEDYKRFYFNDIQAIITRKTRLGSVLNFVLGVYNGSVRSFCGCFRGRVVRFSRHHRRRDAALYG